MIERRRWLCEMTVLLALSSAGCGGHAQQDQGVPGSAGSSGTSPAASGGTSNDTGAGVGGSTLIISDPPARPSTLAFEAWGGPAGKVIATVDSMQPGAGPATCAAPLKDGACQVTACPRTLIGLPVMGYGDFGPMSASVGATTEPITYTGYGYGTTSFPESVALGTGGIMTFHGGNIAGVPEFSVSATIPGLAVLTSPLPASDGAAAVVDTSEDLAVTWSPIAIGQIRFQLDGHFEIGQGTVTLECTFEGAAGTGVVSRTLLSALKEMSPAGPASALLSSELAATTVVDGLTITTLSHQLPATPNQAVAVTLE